MAQPIRICFKHGDGDFKCDVVTATHSLYISHLSSTLSNFIALKIGI